MKKNKIVIYTLWMIEGICIFLLGLSFIRIPCFELFEKIRVELISLIVCTLMALLFYNSSTHTRYFIVFITIITLVSSYSNIRKLVAGRLYFFKNKLEFIHKKDLDHISNAYNAMCNKGYDLVLQSLDSCSNSALKYYSFSTDKMRKISKESQYLVDSFEDILANTKMTPRLFQTLQMISNDIEDSKIDRLFEEIYNQLCYHISCIDSLECASILREDVDFTLCHEIVDRHKDYWFDGEFIKLLDESEDNKYREYLSAAYGHMLIEGDGSAIKYLENVWGIQ